MLLLFVQLHFIYAESIPKYQLMTFNKYYKDKRPNVMQGATAVREKAETSDRSQLLLCSHLTLS